MSRSVGSRRIFEESGSSGHLTRRISMRTRGEFFSFDKYVKMSYRSQKVDFPSPCKWHAGPVQIDTMVTMSRRHSNEFKHGRKDLSLQKVKVTYKSEPTGHGTEEINSIIEKQESKSSAELKYKATSIKYKNQNNCKKESQDAPLINFPGDNSTASELLNIKPKTEINLPIRAVLEATWCGSLEILDKDSGCQFYDGFVAHLPGKVCRKALEHTQLMPNVLPCTMLSCCNVWEEIFQNEIPAIEDIAVFFFPGNFERSKEQYFSLVQVMETQDLILRSLIKGVNLLIFSSKRLHLDPCGLKMKSFLWGIYCPLQLTNDSQAHLMKASRLDLPDAGDAALPQHELRNSLTTQSSMYSCYDVL